MHPLVRVLLLAATVLPLPALGAGSRGFAGLYAEADSEDGFGLAADLTLNVTARTAWYVLAAYSDLSSSVATVSTRGVETGVYHDFGDVGLDVALGTWSDPDLLTARHVKVSVDWHGEVWTIAAIGQFRGSDFEPFQASGTITLRDGRQVTIAAVADCRTDDVGLGLRAAFRNGAWDGYATGMSYDYDETRCGFSSPGLQLLARTRPEVFRQLAPLLTARMAAYATTRIGAENSLLKDDLSAGIGYQPGRTGWGLDYNHHREFFRGLKSDTLSGRVSFGLTDGVEALLTAGATASDTFDTIWFGGVGLRTRF